MMFNKITYMLGKGLKAFFIPLIIIFIVELFMSTLKNILIQNYVYVPLFNFIYAKTQHNNIVMAPIDVFIYTLFLPLIYIILVIILLTKIGFNINILKYIPIKKIFIFVIILCSIHLLIFFPLTNALAIFKSSFLKFNNQLILLKINIFIIVKILLGTYLLIYFVLQL